MDMDALSEYLMEHDEHIQLPDEGEVRRIQRAIETFLKTIMNSVQAKDPRLYGKLIPVGSFYSELKIGSPDEFDFIYELQTLEEGVDFEVMPSGFKGINNLWKTPRGHPGRRKILVKNPSRFLLENDEDRDPDIWLHRIGGGSRAGDSKYVMHPVDVKNSLYNAIFSVLPELEKSLPRYLTLDMGQECSFLYGPAVTLFFKWEGRLYKNLNISVDITVAVKAMNWGPHFDFLRPDYMASDSFIRRILIEEISQNGYHLVPHISDRGYIQWKISTSFLETRVLARFPRNSTIKRLIRIVKSVKNKHLKYRPNYDLLKDQTAANAIKFWQFYSGEDYDENFHNLVSSYMIKTCVFSLCGFATFSEWKNASLSTLYLLALVFLYKAINEGVLTNVFISSQKLIVPAHFNILPGFYQCFQEANTRVNQDVRLVSTATKYDLEKLRKEPYTKQAALTIFRTTSKRINEDFAILWNSE